MTGGGRYLAVRSPISGRITEVDTQLGAYVMAGAELFNVSDPRRIQIDAGACKALQNRHSLLAVGIKQVLTGFENGEIIEILDEDNNVIAVAKAKIDSGILANDPKTKNLEVAHADNIVLL